jgi:hypothetical protein
MDGQQIPPDWEAYAVNVAGVWVQHYPVLNATPPVVVATPTYYVYGF